MATVEVVGTPVHILEDSAVTASVQFYADGVIADPGVTAATITNMAGSVQGAAARATSGLTTAPRTVALSATDTGNLDTLTITWTTTNLGTLTTTHEVVGAFLFTVAEARAFRPNDSGGAPLASTTKYTTAAIEAARAAILDELETITGQAFVPRYRYEIVNGSGLSDLSLDRFGVTAVRSLDTRASGGAIWTAYTADELADVYVESFGQISRESRGSFTSGRRNLRIGYEYGHTRPPRDIVRAALMMLVDTLVASNVSDRAISVSGDLGSTQLFTAGVSARGTALYSSPEVNRILSNHVLRRVVIA